MNREELDYISDRIEGYRAIHPMACREEFHQLIEVIVGLHLTWNGA